MISGGTADACNCKHLMRKSRTIAGFLMSWICGTPGLSDALCVEPQILLCHCCDVVLLVGVLPLSVEVDQFLGQSQIERIEIIKKSIDIAVFPILSVLI